MNDLTTSRSHLSALLTHLAQAPELLLRPHVVEHLDETIASYQHHYELLSGELLTPSSTPKRLAAPHPAAMPHKLDRKDDALDIGTHLKDELFPNEEENHHMAQTCPSKQASSSRHKPVEQGVSGGTLVMVNRLPELFEVLDHGLEGRHLIEQIERLKAWSLREEYLELKVSRQLELAQYLVARLRHVQDNVAHHDAQTYRSRFRDIAVGIMELFKSGEQDVGFIYGLKLDDEPQHGASWEDDARHWREALLEHITPPDLDAPHPSSVSKPKRERPTHASMTSPTPESLEIYVPALRGKRILCVGGVRKPHQIENLEAWFEPGELVWIESEQEKGVRKVQRECDRIEDGRYDVVCLFVRALSHAESGMLVQACKQTEHVVHRVCIETGFGPGGWREGLERVSPPFSNSDEEE